MEILGKQVVIKNHICSPDGVHYRAKPERFRLQMSVETCAFCPGRCPFCVAGCPKKEEKLDIGRFYDVMKRLGEEELVRGVKFTGGEPFWDVPLLNEAVEVVFETCPYGVEVALSTNGAGLDRLSEIGRLTELESIHLSRHHYDDEKNRALFGGWDAPSSGAIRDAVASVPFPDLFVVNCLLMKDAIGTAEEVHRFLDWAISAGLPKVGFVELMPVNGFCREQLIRCDDALRQDDPSLLFTRGLWDYDICRCRDGGYMADDGRLIEFYDRTTKKDGYAYCRGLVFGSDGHLRTGYGGEIIV